MKPLRLTELLSTDMLCNSLFVESSAQTDCPSEPAANSHKLKAGGDLRFRKKWT